MATSCQEPIAFIPNSFHYLRYSGIAYLHQPGAEAISCSDLRRAKLRPHYRSHSLELRATKGICYNLNEVPI